jgi:predicted small metal-binding protein
MSVEGEAPADVMEQVVEHLRSEHDIELPDAEEILENKVGDNVVWSTPLDDDARLVLERLREQLNIDRPDLATDADDTTSEPDVVPTPAAGKIASPPQGTKMT